MNSISRAEKRIKDFECKYGQEALRLAYHAALPVAINTDLVHLLRINFFLDPPQFLPHTAEFELLLSPLCREIDEGLYEIEPEIRDILLKGLYSINDGQRLEDVATLLWKYIDKFGAWRDRVELERAQQLTAFNILDPKQAKKWLLEEETRTTSKYPATRDWFVAMHQDLEQLDRSVEEGQQAEEARQNRCKELIEHSFSKIKNEISRQFENADHEFKIYSYDWEEGLDIDEICLNKVDSINVSEIIGEIEIKDASCAFDVAVEIEFSMRFTRIDYESYIKELHEDAGFPTVSGVIPHQCINTEVKVYASFISNEIEIEDIDLIIEQPIQIDYQDIVYLPPDMSEDFDNSLEDEDIPDSNSQDHSPLKVFISYSHDSKEHVDRVLILSNRLRLDGIDCNIDQYEVSPPEGWSRWMRDQIHHADFVLVVCTERYSSRFRGNEADGTGVAWEGAVIIQELYDPQVHNSKFIPITLNPQDIQHIPIPLRGYTCYQLSEDGYSSYESLYRRLTNQLATPTPQLGRPTLLPRDRHQNFPMTKNSNSQPSIASIRQLIQNALSDDDLNNLCQDEFSKVYNLFTSGQTRSQRIRLLVDHVDRQREITKLLNVIEQINPNAYHEFISEKQVESQENSSQQLKDKITEEARQLLIAAHASDNKIIFALATFGSKQIMANNLDFVDGPESLTRYQYAIAQLVEKNFIVIKDSKTGVVRYELAAKGYEFCITAAKSQPPVPNPSVAIERSPVSRGQTKSTSTRKSPQPKQSTPNKLANDLKQSREIDRLLLIVNGHSSNVNDIVNALTKLGRMRLTKGNPKVVTAVSNLLIFSKNLSAQVVAVETLGKVAKDDSVAIQRVTNSWKNSIDPKLKKAIIRCLGTIAEQNSTAINKLVSILQSLTNIEKDSPLIQITADSLGKIAVGDRRAIQALETKLRFAPATPKVIRKNLARNLEKVDPGNSLAAKYQ
jgi:Effector-associated domain 7/TIR domain